MSVRSIFVASAIIADDSGRTVARSRASRGGGAGRLPFAAVECFPPVSAEYVLAELGHDVREVHRYPVLHNLSVLHLPEVHVADLHLPAGRRDPHELAAVHRVLGAEAGRPLPHVETRLVDRDLVGERGLERPLPVVLKCGKPVFGAASEIAAPDEVRGEEFADVVDAVVVERVDHRLDDAPGVLGLAEVGISRKKGLFGPVAFHSSHPLTAPAVRPLTIWRWKIITSRNSGAVMDTAAAIAST